MTPLPQEPSVERRRPVGVADEDEVDRVEVWKVAELGRGQMRTMLVGA